MPSWLIKNLVTVIAVGFIALHLAYPNLKVDAITISLIIIAISPWFIQFLKSFEFPGGIKIELKDVIEVAKEIKAPINIQAESDLAAIETVATVEVKPLDQIGVLRSLASTDPNLTLVGLRIEIERRIRELARYFDYAEKMRLSSLITELRKSNALDPKLASALFQVVSLGNQAAHGAQVTREAAEWIAGLAPGLIQELDDVIVEKRKR
jgi:hypothetical protein